MAYVIQVLFLFHKKKKWSCKSIKQKKMDLVRIILVYILTLQNREKSFFYVFFMFYQLMQWEKNITVKLIVVIHSYKWTHDVQWTSNDEEEKIFFFTQWPFFIGKWLEFLFYFCLFVCLLLLLIFTLINVPIRMKTKKQQQQQQQKQSTGIFFLVFILLDIFFPSIPDKR